MKNVRKCIFGTGNYGLKYEILRVRIQKIGNEEKSLFIVT